MSGFKGLVLGLPCNCAAPGNTPRTMGAMPLAFDALSLSVRILLGEGREGNSLLE